MKMIKTNLNAVLKPRIRSHVAPHVLNQLCCIHLKYVQFIPAKLGALSGTFSWYNSNSGIFPCYSLACFLSTNTMYEGGMLAILTALLTSSQFCVYCHILKLGTGIFYILPPSMCSCRKKKSCLPLLHFSVSLTLALCLCIKICICYQPRFADNIRQQIPHTWVLLMP